MLMSLSRPSKSKNKKRGRISYAQLGINQLGAVYEALLSYRGFFAQQDLYEVKKKGENPSELETGYFVTAEQLPEYQEDEKVYTSKREAGETKKRLKTFAKGSFIYRMAGRDREKSASYYTPEVLTKSLVKYALKELFKEKIEPLKTAKAKADAIINLTVCEPAMGSAAFLNEAINQLSEFYLIYKQQAENKRIPQDQYTKELQQVKMYIADNNVFGVDLNPVAVELAEVSLWLNAISSDAFVPWFGYQLFNGNSLIGARRQVFPAHQLEYKSLKSPSWLNQAPTRVGFNDKSPNEQREEHQVYHFLLGDNGMANYTDKVVKGLKTDEIASINKWRKEFNKPWLDEEKSQLQRISKKIDDLWQEHTDSRSEQRKVTTDQLPIWPNKADALAISNMTEKDRLLDKAMTDGSSSYQRLKMVMDYWCALWFWPIDSADELPERDEYLFDVETLLDGYIQPELIEDDEVGEEQNEQVSTDFELTSDNETNVGESFDMFGEDLVQETDQVEKEQSQYTSILTAKGTLNKKVIFKNLPRLEIADKLAQQYKYFHWELEFADIFSTNQGFDLILGNPPWLRVEWQEAGILGEYNPLLNLRKFSATKLTDQRSKIFDEISSSKKAYLREYSESAGAQSFLNAKCNYIALNGQKANLYKCFLPKAWEITNLNGVSAYVHPEGIYDDPRGGSFRKKIYSRLRAHFQFQNQKMLFPIGHRVKFSLNIFGKIHNSPEFISLANLFAVKTIDLCLKHNGEGPVGGIKTDEGDWDETGHKDRILTIDKNVLALFAKLYDGDGISAFEARLPTLHSIQLLEALKRFANQKLKLCSLGDEWSSSTMWNETNAQKDKLIKRDTNFPSSVQNTIYSGPHIYLGNPLYKTPRLICTEKGHYDCIDLTNISSNYFPRSNYLPSAQSFNLQPKVKWIDEGKNQYLTSYYRCVNREMLSQAGERTFISCLLTPGVAHLYTAVSVAFKSNDNLVDYYASTLSLPFDFYVKSTGVGHANTALISQLPLIYFGRFRTSVILRSLVLGALTAGYADIWHHSFNSSFSSEQWAKKDHRLSNKHFENITPDWNTNSALRFDYERRQALVEIDVLVAMAMGMTKNELQTIYRIQFPVLSQNEDDTWYDQTGRIVFTASKGLVGVGLDRKFNKKNAFVTGIKNGVYIDKTTGTGSEEQPHTEAGIQLGWEDIKSLKSGIVTKTYMDDTMPNGPHERTIEYIAPFDKCNREDDYNTVWAEFERRFSEK